MHGIAKRDIDAVARRSRRKRIDEFQALPGRLRMQSGSRVPDMLVVRVELDLDAAMVDKPFDQFGRAFDDRADQTGGIVPPGDPFDIIDH